MIRLLIVDDHVLFREGLAAIIRGEPDIEVVGFAGSVKEAGESALSLKPDVVLMDFGMPDGTGANATRQIFEANDVAGTVSRRAGDAGELFTLERRGQYEQAANEISEAQVRLDAGRKSRVERDFAEVGSATGRARVILVGLSEGLDAAIANRDAALGELAEVGRAIQSADALDREIDSRKVVLNDALNGMRQLGRQALGRARGRLPDGSRSPTIQASAAIADARRDAQVASNHFTQILEEIRRLGQQEMERRLTLLLRSARDMFTFVDEAFDTFDRRAAARPEKVDTTERQTIERRVQAARRQLDLATKSGDVGGIETARRSAEQARDRLNVLISAFGPLSLVDRGVHPALERGAQLFLTGEHQQALAALSPAEPFLPDMPLLLHVHLFRAAALHGLYLRSGASDSSLRDRAQTETAMVKALDRGFQPDPRVFSPRFLEFFRAISQPDETPVGPVQP